MSAVSLIAVLRMAVHKVECWRTSEWSVSPFFRWLIARAKHHAEGEVVFLVFIAWLFGGLGMGWMLLLGGWGPILALATWGLTFVLEWHHLARSVRHRGYYPGLIPAIACVCYGPYSGYSLWSFAQEQLQTAMP